MVSSGWNHSQRGQALVVARGDKTGGLGRGCGHGEEFEFFLRELRAMEGCRQRKDWI